MTLTKTQSTSNIAPPRTDYEGGRENSIRTGDKTPQYLAVFLCLSFAPIGGFIMMGLFGQSQRLAAPVRGILTPCNPVTHTVRSISGGYSYFRTGITA